MLLCNFPPLQPQLTSLGLVFLCLSFVVISQSGLVPFILLYPITTAKATGIIYGGKRRNESPKKAYPYEMYAFPAPI